MTDSVIVIEDLTYTYPNSDQPTLKDVNLEIERGEFVLVVGKSGCGKSTLVRCINGLIPHLFGGEINGRVLVHGKEVGKHPIWKLARHVGMVFQNPTSQLFTLTVENEVAFGPENFGVPREDLERRVDWALECVGMKESRSKSVFELSDGQKQRVAIAANLSMFPNILILDEPTSNLDARGTQELFEVLEDLKRSGKTIVLIEHRIDHAIKCADKVIIMDSGEIKLIDSPSILLKDQVRKFGIRSPKAGFSLANLSERSDSADPLVKVLNLHYSYGEEFAIENVSTEIYDGEAIGIMGSNGSGKTTLVKCFVGLLKPTRGKVIVDGTDTHKVDVSTLARKVGLVLQNPDHQLFMDTVYNEVSFGLKYQNLPERGIKERVKDALEMMGLWELRDRHPHSLSEGQKQRVTIASTLVRKPEVLILDEPTSGMDGYHMRMLVDKLNELKKDLTIVLVSHDAEMISKVCDRVMVLDEGRIVSVATILPSPRV